MKVNPTSVAEKSNFISQSELSPILNSSRPVKMDAIVGFEDLIEDEADEFL
jgi:hypothetical protein